jgi:predicted N-formylglutamate amidohydrolase
MHLYSPFEIINEKSSSNLIFICEHASNFIPPAYDNLGLSERDLSRHIALDIGAKDLTIALAQKLSAPAINACFSRLLIDPNRALQQHGLIPEISDKTIIEGNQDLCPDKIQKRIDKYYQPFHDAAAELIDDNPHPCPLIINIHSFTETMNGVKRPWKIGLLWNEDHRLRNLILPELSNIGFNVGDNQPYSGKDLYFTLDHHAAPRGLPHIMFEIRQDQINTANGVQKYCGILLPIISKISKIFAKN